MCIFVSRPLKIVTFLLKNGYHPKRVVEFLRERETFRNKIMEIVEDFDEKSYNNNGKSWKSSRILRVNPFFFHFSFFIIFLHFFDFFSFFHLFFIFSFFHFLFFSPVFCLFSFLFFIFSHFCSFLLRFYIFSLFPKKKVSSFLFSCISFKYFLLLALVSEFNCFVSSVLHGDVVS